MKIFRINDTLKLLLMVHEFSKTKMYGCQNVFMSSDKIREAFLVS